MTGVLEAVKSIASNEGFVSEVPHLYGGEEHHKVKSHEFDSNSIPITIAMFLFQHTMKEKLL